MRAILFILLSFGVGCAATPGFHAEIHDANRRLESDFNRGDHPAVAEAYLDDAMLVGPGGQVVTGRGAIDAYWMRPWVDAHWDLTVRSIEGSSEMPVQRGLSVLRYDREGAPVVSRVEFLLFWRRDDAGRYRISLDAFCRAGDRARD
jgi:ketosteroid isomerase-like protein